MPRIFPITKIVQGGGSSGMTDAFSLAITAGESNALPTDDSTFVINLAQAETSPAPTETTSLNLQGFVDTNPIPTESAPQLNIQGLGDTNPVPTETTQLNIQGLGDVNPTPMETAQLAFPAPDFGDTNPIPSEARKLVLKVWQNGSTGTSNVTNPTNADGQNNGMFSSQQTAALGAAVSTLTSLCGNKVPSVTVTAASYQGWFKFTTVLPTSVVSITAHSPGALYADVTVFTQSGANLNVDHSTGDFTFDLFAAGINTLAKLQDTQFLYQTTDAAAGITPAVLQVDAGSINATATL